MDHRPWQMLVEKDHSQWTIVRGDDGNSWKQVLVVLVSVSKLQLTYAVIAGSDIQQIIISSGKHLPYQLLLIVNISGISVYQKVSADRFINIRGLKTRLGFEVLALQTASDAWG